MRRACATLVVLAALGSSSVAHATAGTAYAETSDVAAVAGAVVARPGNAGTIAANPAGLADPSEAQVVLNGHFTALSESFARTGETKTALGRSFGGFGFAAASPLPGVLSGLHVGVALDLPAEHILRVYVPVRADQPVSALYGSRPDRIGAMLALAYALGPLKLGAGLSVSPSLETPTEVTYVAGRGKTVDKSVVVRLDRSLSLAISPTIGVRAQPLPWLEVGLVYRGAAISHATGTQRTVAGGIVANDPIDFYQFWSPAELALGAAWKPRRAVTLSCDLTWHQWSAFRTGFDGEPSPEFRDTVSLRAGISIATTRWSVLRAGIAVEPSPIREQVGNSNYLGANTNTFSIGGGLDLRPIAHVPIAIDAHVRARVSAVQSAHKDPAQLPDASAELPGKQIDNLGYPGLTSQASSLQAGLTVTFFLSKERP